MNDNMRIYDAVRSVPDIAKKQFNNGTFSGTDINPMWRIKTLTEQFGACGIGWYYEVLSERAETYGDTVMAIVDINLYIKSGGEWSKPIFGTGGNQLVKSTKQGTKPSDEGYKMALTDALSVACKALGIGADVYFDKDVTKYTQRTNRPEEETKSNQKADVNKHLEIQRTCNICHFTLEQFGEHFQEMRKSGECADKGTKEMSSDEFMTMITLMISKYAKEIQVR